MDNAKYQDMMLNAIGYMTAAVINIRLYSFQHPQVNRLIEKAFTFISKALMFRKELTLLIIGDDLIIDDSPVRKKGDRIEKFVLILRKNAIDRLTFISGIPKPDFVTLITSIASSGEETIRSSKFITLGKVGVHVVTDNSPPELNETEMVKDFPSDMEDFPHDIVEEEDVPEQSMELMNYINDIRNKKIDDLKELYFYMKRYKKIDVRSLEGIVKAFIMGISHNLNPLKLLAEIKSSDDYTFTHVVNVCLLTLGQAEALGFTGPHLHDIGIASLLHDTGKCFIPDEILNKPSRLDDQERKIIETHPIEGARYIMNLDGIPKLAILGALEHHIRFDGTGYPSFSQDWKPNIISQMIAISDVYDAMRSKRCYQNAKPESLILKILTEEKGTTFNPVLIDNFLKIINQIKNQGLK